MYGNEDISPSRWMDYFTNFLFTSSLVSKKPPGVLLITHNEMCRARWSTQRGIWNLIQFWWRIFFYRKEYLPRRATEIWIEWTKLMWKYKILMMEEIHTFLYIVFKNMLFLRYSASNQAMRTKDKSNSVWEMMRNAGIMSDWLINY